MMCGTSARKTSMAGNWNHLEAPSHTLCLRGGPGPTGHMAATFLIVLEETGSVLWSIHHSLQKTVGVHHCGTASPALRVPSIHPRTEGLGQPLAQVKLPSPVSPRGASWGHQLTYPNLNPQHRWTPCEWFFFPSETKNKGKGIHQNRRDGAMNQNWKPRKRDGCIAWKKKGSKE